jgi:hypothetical protein
MKENAYVYCHIRKDKNEIFYIGIATKKTRAYESFNRRNNIWGKIASKTDYDIAVLYENLSWEQACEIERQMIKSHGKIYDNTGTLANITDGGDGTIGMIRTNEHLKGVKLTEQHKLNIKNGLLNSKKIRKPYSAEYKKVISDRMKANKYTLGIKLSEETRLKMSVNNAKTNNRKVIDTISLEEYSSLKDLYKSNFDYFNNLGLKYSSCVAQLRGQNKNRTNYMYLDLYLQKQLTFK